MDNKTRIITESKALFLKLGIRSVSMDDIANQLGISKKTIYQLFADKDELVDNIIDTDIQQIQADCTNCCETAKDAIDEIFKGQRGGSTAVVAYMDRENKKMYSAWAGDSRAVLGKFVNGGK